MRRLFVFALIASLVLTLIGLGALRVGAGRAHPSALRDLDACGLPCWSAISPRETALDDAQTALLSKGYHEHLHDTRFRFIAYDAAAGDSCRVSLNYSGGVVTLLNLSRCPHVRLGDVIAQLGSPDGILDSGTALTFRGGHVVVVTRTMVCDRWFSPDLPVLSIYLLNGGMPQRRMMATVTVSDAAQAFDWRGFGSEALYANGDSRFPTCPW